MRFLVTIEYADNNLTKTAKFMTYVEAARFAIGAQQFPNATNVTISEIRSKQ